jgi:hypothetical protein
MLEPHVYRAVEQLAKTQLPSWLVAQPHNLDHFLNAGFPVRINSIRELGQVIDSMQEGRFDGYMRELGGLTDDEYARIQRACRDIVRFQQIYLPNRPPVLPLSTLLSAFALYKKIRGFRGDVRSVLEVGPGCGYLSFFLKDHDSLQNYSQIEACESFYILQNLVNGFCFDTSFDERAMPSSDACGLDYFVARSRKGLEFSPRLQLPAQEPRCTHYPWWRIGELASRNRKFNVVTSNANLLEFNPSALEDYLALFHQVMEENSIFLVQCPGYPAQGSYDTLLDKLWEKGFALLAFLRELTPVSLSLSFRPRTALDYVKGEGRGPTTFIVNNALLVRAGHPLFEKYRDRKNFHLGFCGQEELVDSVFFARPPDRRPRPWQDFVESTEKAVSG